MAINCYFLFPSFFYPLFFSLSPQTRTPTFLDLLFLVLETRLSICLCSPLLPFLLCLLSFSPFTRAPASLALPFCPRISSYIPFYLLIYLYHPLLPSLFDLPSFSLSPHARKKSFPTISLLCPRTYNSWEQFSGFSMR